MKTKTIRHTLNRKFSSWVKTITDEKVKELVEANSIITGGCITSMFLQEPVNDYDVYFTNVETAKAVVGYYIDLYKKNKGGEDAKKPISAMEYENGVKIFVRSAGIDGTEIKEDSYRYFEIGDPGQPDQEEFLNSALEIGRDRRSKKTYEYRPILLTSNALTLSDDIQLIIRFCGTPEEIHKNFDFVHTTNYWTSINNKLVLNTEALACILSKELKYIGSLYPLTSVVRLRKFTKRGWSINAGHILKICYQISNLNLNDPKVLEEQLIGVDVAYFSDLIKKIKSDDRKVDETYIAELVDKIFD